MITLLIIKTTIKIYSQWYIQVICEFKSLIKKIYVYVCIKSLSNYVEIMKEVFHIFLVTMHSNHTTNYKEYKAMDMDGNNFTPYNLSKSRSILDKQPIAFHNITKKIIILMVFIKNNDYIIGHIIGYNDLSRSNRHYCLWK